MKTSTFIFLLLLVCPASLPAAEVTSKVVDGLGRPVSNAVVDIHWLKSFSDQDVRKMELVKLVSDRNGIIRGSYDEKAIPRGEDIWVEISGPGYRGYSTTALQPEFVLEREFGAGDVPRIAMLDGAAQVNELRELLAGEFEDSELDLNELVFNQEHQFRPGLRTLVPDPKVGRAAGQLLAFIGVPEDLRLFLDHAPQPKKELFEDRWAYGIACALLEPSTPKEWAFLRNCALNEYEDRWVDAGAIRTLKLMASPESKELLKEVAAKNRGRADSALAAIKYIDSAPPPLADEDLVVAGRKVAEAIRMGKWQKNQLPHFNQNKDKAFIACEFIAGRDLLVHTATFHKVGTLWKLRGVRETMQALLRAPVKEADGDKQK